MVCNYLIPLGDRLTVGRTTPQQIQGRLALFLPCSRERIQGLR